MLFASIAVVTMFGNLVAAPDVKVVSNPVQAQVQKSQPVQKDWANHNRYESSNKSVKNPVAVFMGDSITAGWYGSRKDFFESNNYLGRGIGGQTTAHMLVRFRADVIDLKPKAVAIMAGINDIAENNGFTKVEYVFENIASMAELAKAHGIKVLICSTLPCNKIAWRKSVENVAEKVKTLNAMLKDFADKNGFVYVDYYSKLVDDKEGLPAKYSKDGVHINSAAYAILEPIIKAEIEREQPMTWREWIKSKL